MRISPLKKLTERVKFDKICVQYSLSVWGLCALCRLSCVFRRALDYLIRFL